MKPKISVVMAVYCGGRYIEEQIKSILTQSYPVDELILIEDSSPEPCADVISHATGIEIAMSSLPDSETGIDDSSDRHAKTDMSGEVSGISGRCTVHYLEHSERKGYAQTFFDALSLATGDFIFFSDQDDIWEKDKVAVCVKVMKSYPDITCLSAANTLIDGKGREIGKDRRLRDRMIAVSTEDLIMQKHGALRPGMSTVIRRSLKEKIDGMDISAYEMHDRLIEYLAATEGGYRRISSYLARYRIHDDNTSGMNLSHTKLRTGLDGRIDQIDKELKYLEQIRGISESDESVIDKEIDYFNSRRKLLKNKNIIKYIICSLRLLGRYSSKKIWLGDIAGILKG